MNIKNTRKEYIIMNHTKSKALQKENHGTTVLEISHRVYQNVQCAI
jgi:hypothetical protein